MAFSSDSIGLLFRAKGDTSDARAAFSKLETEIGGHSTAIQTGFKQIASEASNFLGIITGNRLTGATSQLTSLGGTISAIPGPFGLAAGAVGIFTAAMIGAVSGAIELTKSLFDLASQAADYGSQIHDASDKTGLHAQTLLTLKTNAEQSGLSFEQVTAAVGKFNVLLGQSNEGNDKAAATLKKYNITAKDTEGALAQAIKRITEMKTADEQAVAAKELFRDRSGEVLKLIKQMDGDLPGAIQKLKDMGVTMSDEDARAADEFGDTMTALKGQLSAVEFTIGRQLMPTFLNMARTFSTWLSQHQTEIRLWATEFAIAFERVIRGLETVAKWVQDHPNIFRLIGMALLGPAYGTVENFISNAGTELQNTAQKRITSQDRAPSEGSNVPGFNPVDSDVDKDADKAAKERQRAAEKRAKEQAELLKRDLRANLEIESNNLKDERQALEETMQKLREQFLKDGDFDKFAKGVADQWAASKAAMMDTLNAINDIERKELPADALPSEKAALASKQQERINDLRKEGTKIQKENIDTVTKQAENWEKHLKELLEVDQQLIDKEKEAGKAVLDRATAEAAAIDQMNDHFGQFADQLLKAEDLHPVLQEGIFDQWTNSWENFFGIFSEQAPTLGSILGKMAGILQNAFHGLSQALGSVVQQWVLTGKTGPAVMRMILAQALASIAAESAARAIFELAKGFAALFLNPPEAAAHFTAAALFGSIAVGSALAGRAVAGNLFNQQNQGAYGTAGQSASSGKSNDTGNQGKQYSSQSDVVVDTSRGMPFGQGGPLVANIKIGLDSNGILTFLRKDVERGGAMRNLIIDTAST